MHKPLTVLAACLLPAAGCSDDSTGTDPVCGNDVREGDEALSVTHQKSLTIRGQRAYN